MTKISALQSDLTVTKAQYAAMQQKLKTVESVINRVTVAMKNTNAELANERISFKNLQVKQDNYAKELVTQKTNLAREMRACYRLGSFGYLKMILNQENLSELGRLQTYYLYILAKRNASIVATNVVLGKAQQNSTRIQAESKVLEKLYAKESSEKLQLEKLQAERSVALKTLKQNLQAQTLRLNQLLSDKAELENALTNVGRGAQRGTKLSGSILVLQKKLLLIDSGKSNAELRLNGVIIAAREGVRVHAISAGKVVFADWLGGYGLLLIIDHGHGYMSLYGRNHGLYKRTGDKVGNGEVIAEVGRSGGYEKAALYFAMRYNGKPVDPTVWSGK